MAIYLKRKALVLVLIFACHQFGFSTTVMAGEFGGVGAGFLTPDKILPVDDAFSLQLVKYTGGASLIWSIHKGYYLYRDRIQVKLDGEVLAVNLREGKLKLDPHFGEVEVYHGQLEIDLNRSGSEAEAELIQVSYQGCAEVGVCYPPQSREFTLPQ